MPRDQHNADDVGVTLGDEPGSGEGLAAAAGCLSGCAMSTVFWLAVAAAVWWWRS